MKFLALEHEKPSTQPVEFAPYLISEAHRVWELYQSGIIREIYFHADQHTAILILESTDSVSAQESLSSLPLVQAGLIEFELIPLAPYPGFARLFATVHP